MKTVVVLLLLSAMPALAATRPGVIYTGAELSADGKTLTLVRRDGAHRMAPLLPQQVGFDRPQVAPDGRHVGWLALFPNCCTSYPVPLTLAMLDTAGRLQVFHGPGDAVFAWCFVPGTDAVAFMHTVLHGSNYEGFEEYSLRSGKRVAEYEYPDDAQENGQARKAAPDWVRCVPE